MLEIQQTLNTILYGKEGNFLIKYINIVMSIKEKVRFKINKLLWNNLPRLYYSY